MQELKAGVTDAAVEKHVPVYTIEGSHVHVVVGETKHPMIEEHFIEWITLNTNQGIYLSLIHILKTEIERDISSADAVHKLVNDRLGRKDFNEIKSKADENTELFKNMSTYMNEIKTLNSTRYIYTANRNEDGRLIYVVDGLDPSAGDVRHPGDPIEKEMVPYIEKALSGKTVYSQDIVDTTWGPIFTACYPVTADDESNEVIGAFCIEMDMQKAYGMVEKTNKLSICLLYTSR